MRFLPISLSYYPAGRPRSSQSEILLCMQTYHKLYCFESNKVVKYTMKMQSRIGIGKDFLNWQEDVSR